MIFRAILRVSEASVSLLINETRRGDHVLKPIIVERGTPVVGLRSISVDAKVVKSDET
jgi:hypothetical protein